MSNPLILSGYATCVLLCATVGTAHGQIFATESALDRPGTIGKYTFSGATLNRRLVSGLLQPEGIAVSGDKLFVADLSAGTIGEYTSSGTTMNRALISGLRGPIGIAVSEGFLYVTNISEGTVGKYTMSGETVNAALISGLGNGLQGIAISGEHLFVTTSGLSLESNGTIGEFTTSGATVNRMLVSGLDYPVDIAVSGDSLFVANVYGGTIGEYTTSGTPVNPALISGLDAALAIAMFGENLFVGSFDNISHTGRIGEYTVSGEPVNPTLISGLNGPFGIAVSEPAPPSAPDASSTWSLLLLALATLFGVKPLLRKAG